MVKMTESSHRTPPHPNSQSNPPPPPPVFSQSFIFLDSTYVLVVLIYTEDNKTLNNNVSNICQHLKLDLRKKNKTKKTINFFAGKFQRFSGFCFFTHTIQHLFHFCNFLLEGNALTTNEACRFHRKLERYVTRGHYWASREIRGKIL